MNGSGILLDTNGVIHFLEATMPPAGLAALKDRAFHLSFISEIELRSLKPDRPESLDRTLAFLAHCARHGLSESLKDQAVRLRIDYGLKTPDALIVATAIVKNLPFLTGDKGLRHLDHEIDILFVQYP